MTIVAFDWVASLAGGALIGLAAVILMVFNGRIAGVSGIVGALTVAKSSDRLWRVVYFLGLVVGVGVALAWSWARQPAASPASTAQLIAAAVLVGVGTALASGCTSGHGVCGLSRGSARSLAATMTFMVAGAVAVYVVRHMLAK